MKVISLFDHSGVMLEPWRDAGYDCWIVDIDHPVGTTERDGIHLVGHDLAVPWLPPFDHDEIVFVAAFPPCTHLAVSGARWFKGKGLRRFANSVTLFATSAEFCEWSGAPYMIENPVSTISTYWRKPDHSFHPWQYAGLHGNDNYTKKTCLWTGGGFTMPPVASPEGAPEPDNRIWEMGPSDMRGRFRSQTPLGFARAVFYANEKKEKVS
tara:strand:+ start:3925 stop:4554 length:630 start_codon:yes stop_codon:yes gene_type:complete